MKILKIVGITLATLVVLIIAAAFIIPIVFKDDIKAAIDKEINKSINADVLFDIDKFDVTLFKNFPNATVEIKEFGVFNREPFAGVPLFVVEQLDVEVNVKELIFGDELRLKGITLIRPQIKVQVLKDGRANYDITYPSADTVQTETDSASTFSFGIDHWEIINGDIIYDDQSLPFYLALKGLNHSGSGNFNEKEFDLNTQTTSDTLEVVFDGVPYISNKRLEANMVLGISEGYTKYTFKENVAKLNDFGLAFDGWFKMNDNSYDMDITYSTQETTFKSLLSLVPGMYTQDFGSIETNGNVTFAGMVKGSYSDKGMPAFNLNVKVKEAMFKYPDLPTPVEHINMDLLVDNKDGIIDHTVVDLKNLHLDFGSNPVDAKLKIDNLKDYRMNANLKAKLNLAELNKMFPMEGLEMKGTYSVNASANGVYDSLKKTIPTLDVTMALADGYVKSSDFPLPLENLNFNSTVKNSSGKMAETVITVSDLSMLLDNEKFTANLILRDLDNYTWDLSANGGIDLGKMTKIFPIEGMTIAGKVVANIETKGKMSDVEAKHYDRLPTKGSATLTKFKFTSKDLPYAVTIDKSTLAFDPSKIDLKNTSGTIGRSDFAVSGNVSNYIAYIFGNNETIRGTVTFNSKLLDLNEFMTDTESTTSTTDTTSFGVIAIPENIDFVLHSSIKTVKMMDYTMTNGKGDIIVKDGVANLKGLQFNMLGGKFTVTGTYQAKNIKHPKYDLGLKIEDLAIQQAASSFSIVKTYAPVAGLVNGNFSTDFKIKGELLSTMMPNMSTVSGAGLIKVAQAALTQSKLVSGVTSLTKLENTDKVTLKDVLMSASIDHGRLSVKPFDVQFGSYKTTVAGSTGLDGTIDYTLKMNVPAGKLGSQLQGFASQYTGAKNTSSEVPVTIGVGGTYSDPKTKLLMQEQKNQVKQAVTEVVEQKSKEAVKQALEGQDPKSIVNNLLKKDTTTAKKDTTKAKAPDATEQLQNSLQNLLKKKKKNN